MMKAKSNIIWSRRFLMFLTAPAIWFGLTSGVFSLSIGSIDLGAIEVTSAFAILFLVTNKRVGNFVEGRPLQIVSIVIAVLALIFLGITKINDLLTTKLYLLGDIYIPNVIVIVAAIGYLFFLALLIVELAKLTRMEEN